MEEKRGGRLVPISEVVVWTLVSGGALFATWGIVSAFAQSSAAFALALVFPPVILVMFLLMLGGPGTVLIAGIRKRRLGMIAGPLLLVPIIAAYSITSSWFEMRRLSDDVAKLDMRTFAAQSRHHNLVILEYSRSTDCDDLCQQILVGTDYNVGVPGYGSEPVVYREITEAECKATWYSAKNIRFAGICVTMQQVQIIDDALLIVTPATLISGGGPGWDLFRNLPLVEFSGNAFALVERNSVADDRVLGRWVAGEITVWPFNSGPIGKSFDRKDFYSAALGLALSDRPGWPALKWSP